MPNIPKSNKSALKSATKPKARTTKSNTTSLTRSSSELVLERRRIVCHGASGHGKSFFAGSGAKEWPATLPAKKLTSLKSVLWIGFDAGATDGLKEQKLDAPNVIDVHWLMTKPTPKNPDKPYARTILQALTMITHFAMERVQEGDIDLVVVDTVSSLDEDLKLYWDDNCPTSKAGYRDTRHMWTCLANSHKRFHQAMLMLDADVVFLCHTKALNETDDKTEKNKRLTIQTPGGNELVPKITGQGAATYVNHTSLQVALIAKPVVGEAGEFKRTVYPVSYQGWQAKNRWQRSLSAAGEEAHLGKIFKKIAANQK